MARRCLSKLKHGGGRPLTGVGAAALSLVQFSDSRHYH